MASLFEIVAAGDGVGVAWSFVTYFLPSYPRLFVEKMKDVSLWLLLVLLCVWAY